MTPEGLTRRSTCIAKHESFAVVLFFISLADPHLCKKTQAYLHSLRKSNRPEEISVGENWGLRTAKTWEDVFQHNWGIILYIQSKLFCIIILLNERLGRWYMENFQIRKKNVLSVHLLKTDILILVNSDCIAMEFPENTIAHTHHMPAYNAIMCRFRYYLRDVCNRVRSRCLGIVVPWKRSFYWV